MNDLEYCNPKENEWFDIFYVVAMLSFMFSILFLRFGDSVEYGFIGIFLNFFVFFSIMFILKIFVMKLTALRDGYELTFRQSYFNKFGFRPYDKISYWSDLAQKNAIAISKNVYNKMMDRREKVYRTVPMKIKGIPAILVSLFLYLLTLGFLIYPNVWSYKLKTIPHRFTGTKQRYEADVRLWLYNVNVTDYRFSKSLIMGFFFYFVFGFFLKVFFQGSSELYYWYVSALYWIAFFTLIPIPNSEGFELWRKNLFGWFMIFSILVVGMISLLIFDNVKFIILTLIFTTFVIFFMKIYSYAIKGYEHGPKDKDIKK